MTADPLLYCGMSETSWNGLSPAPGPYACISPIYGREEGKTRTNRVLVPKETLVIQDSGAFSDGPGRRLTFAQALQRQKSQGKRFGYEDQITHRASYDLLIDESWSDDGHRSKRRWSISEAEQAVDTTVRAAEFLAANKDKPAILSAQGVTPGQYADCVRRIIPLLEPDDIFGLGGWCVLGRYSQSLLPAFRETILKAIPLLGQSGVRRVHIWGVIYPAGLCELLWMCDQHGIQLSTDSAGPNLKPVFGSWGYGPWHNPNYVRPSGIELGKERARHVQLTREWFSHLRETRYYQEPTPAPYQQLCLFSDAAL